MKKPDLTRCEIIHHWDVFGNAADGFEVNDSSRREMDLDLTSTRSILQSLRSEFRIKPGSVKVQWNDDTHINVDGRNGRPFLTIYIPEKP